MTPERLREIAANCEDTSFIASEDNANDLRKLADELEAGPSRPVEAQTPEFRVGKSIGTTIYRVGDGQPCGWFPNNPTLAGRVVDLLNAAVPVPDTPSAGEPKP